MGRQEISRQEIRRQEIQGKVYKDLDKYVEKNEKDREEGKESLFFNKVEGIIKSFDKAFEGTGIKIVDIGEGDIDYALDYIADEANFHAHDLYDKEIDRGVLGETAIKYEDVYREMLFYKIEEYVYGIEENNQ